MPKPKKPKEPLPLSEKGRNPLPMGNPLVLGELVTKKDMKYVKKGFKDEKEESS